MFWRVGARRAEVAGGPRRVVMLLENQPYPRDVRVRAEAESLSRAGFQVRVLAPRAPGQARTETVAGVSVRRYRLPMSGGGALGYVLEYAVAHLQLFARGLVELAAGADVLHLHNPPDTLFPVARVARRLGRRTVFDQHDFFPELVASRVRSRRAVAVARAAQRAAAGAASVVLVPNESQRELVLAGSRRDERSVVVVRNGPPSKSLVAEPRFREGALAEPRLIYLGELAPQDGVMILPDLLERPGLRGARLTIVGDGPCRAALEERVGGSPELAGRVSFTGYVHHGRVPELLAEADIGIDPAPPSPFNDVSTMTKIAEYLAAGLPVVAFDLVETRRTAGDAAAYAPGCDAAELARQIGRVATDPSLRAKLAGAAVARAGELVWERSEEALLQAYTLLYELS